MKKLTTLLLLSCLFTLSFGQDLIITGVVDGPLSGGVPKAIELYATSDIANLSIYGFGSANNGGGTDGEEYTFPNDAATAGDFIYIASEATGFTSFFGFAPNYTSSAASINGDDAIELFMNGAVIDVFGDINTDGTGQPWEYLDGWAYRINDTGPDGNVFVLSNWTYSGIDALDGATTNNDPANPFPIGTYGGGSSDVVFNPSGFAATTNGIDAIDVNWTANADNDAVVLAFSTSGALTDVPEDGTSYTAGESLSNGSEVLYVGNLSTFNHAALNENTTYYYKIWSVDIDQVYSSGVSADATTESSNPVTASLVITGVIDGPLSGGVPKAIEFYALEDIQDLSAYGFGSANNGGGSDGEEFSFPAEVVQKGTFIYLATESDGFEGFFGFTPNYTSGSAAINGDDAVELFFNGNVVDVFGDINVDGSGQPWEYADGWAYRIDNTGPDGNTFIIENWTFSGTDVLDGSTTNDNASSPFPIGSYGPDFLITGVIDGPLSGGVPKAIEFYAQNDIADLSQYGFGSANNGGGTDGEEFTFPAVAISAGSYVYVASESPGFTNYFGFAPDYTSSAASINGDDAVELFYQAGVIDVFGDINVDGNGEPWEYLDSWAYRVDGTGPDGSTFILNNWTFGTPDILDGSTTNDNATSPFPIGTYGNGGGPVDAELLTIAEVRAVENGTAVIISGILTVSDQFAGAAYIQDATGGIAVFDAFVHGEGVFQIGDSLTLTGTRSSFNDQVQLSPVQEVIDHGPANNPIVPATITLSELGDHPGELVLISNTFFPNPGDLLFGNSNVLLTDASGDGQLRIDADVSDLVGRVQPDICSEAIGVVGRFFEFYQLLPRQQLDLECAPVYEPPMNPNGVDKTKTLDIVTWNIEWFGDEGNSPASGNPNSDAIQKDSVKAIIQQLQPDILAVQEITDEVLFAQMVNELPGYSYVLSPATSNPDDPETAQKLGFIYNEQVVNVMSSKVLLQSIHPLYNGGDDSAISDYPAETTRFYASGRLPFLISTEIQINGETSAYDFVVLHARANGSTDPQLRYDMRKYDVEVLKDSLDAFYANSNLVLLGDYNDDVDVTVADVETTISTYKEYSDDQINYTVLTRVLSDNNFRSYVFRENMIDHISVTDELEDRYIFGSAQVHYEFYDADYTSTASDHFPVSVQLTVNEMTLVNITSIDESCFEENDGSATVVVSGGIAPYLYLWSDGQTTQTAFDLSPGIYSVSVTDLLGTEIVAVTQVSGANEIVATYTEDNTIYLGYNPNFIFGNPPPQCVILRVLTVPFGEGPYTFEWSNGKIGRNNRVCPEVTTDYTVTITNGDGCTIMHTITVEVIDVRCQINANRPGILMCINGIPRCVPHNRVEFLLSRGHTLGPCEETPAYSQPASIITQSDAYFSAFPNPFDDYIKISFEGESRQNLELILFNLQGKEIQKQISKDIFNGDIITFETGDLPAGMYYIGIYNETGIQNMTKVVKQ